jgi:hypothetical protein
MIRPEYIEVTVLRQIMGVTELDLLRQGGIIQIQTRTLRAELLKDLHICPMPSPYDQHLFTHQALNVVHEFCPVLFATY